MILFYVVHILNSKELSKITFFLTNTKFHLVSLPKVRYTFILLPLFSQIVFVTHDQHREEWAVAAAASEIQ